MNTYSKEINIIDELKWHEALPENEREKLPLPTYFYISRYGRKPYENIEEIANQYSKSCAIEFRTGNVADGKLINGFLIELEKHKKMGKSFDGFVHIELDDLSEDSEYNNFFKFLKTKEGELRYLFSMDESSENNHVRELLEQFFFIRVKQGESYDIEEQMEIVESAVSKFAGISDQTVIDRIKECLGKYLWNSKDNVKNKIEGLVQNGMYNCILEGMNLSRIVEEFEKNKPKEKIPFGFG